MKILIDGDACPKTVLQLCLKYGRHYGIPVWTVASFNHVVDSDYHIVVGDAPQETDLKVVNLTEEGDLVITQDIGLAALVMAKKAKALSPHGREYRPELMSTLLEERELKAKYRRGGGRTKGPSKRTSQEDQQFEVVLDSLLREMVSAKD